MTPNLVDHLQPLEEFICLQILPVLTQQEAFNDILHYLLSLPTPLGGMGIINPLTVADI